MNDYMNVLKKWNNFKDRAGRQEYWMFFLFNIVVAIVLGIVDAVTGVPILGTIYSLAVLIPGIAVTIRRLHDTDRSGWWVLAAFIPFAGLFILLFFMIQGGTPGPNKFGESPAGHIEAA